MGIKDRGFASLSPEQRRQISSKGGKAAHQQGVARRWTLAEAWKAGAKGGNAAKYNRTHKEPTSR